MYDPIVPPRQKPKTDDGHFEILCQSVFQAGFSWKVVRNKWPNFQKAFLHFNIKKVAAFKTQDVTRLTKDAGIIRNTQKIMAVIENAHIALKIQKEYGSFKKFILSLRKLPYEERRKILSDTFPWVGPTGAFHFFWSIGEEVPKWEDRNR
jgi:DNA-3-methyladenine glycosylase I